MQLQNPYSDYTPEVYPELFTPLELLLEGEVSGGSTQKKGAPLVLPKAPKCGAPPCLADPCLDHNLPEIKLLPSGNIVPGPLKLCPAVMNPGFIDASTDTVTHAKWLQGALDNLVTTKYAATKAHMSAALVDLTGARLFAPEFAGWRETVQTVGGSVPKLLPLYALFQLRQDLQLLANSRHIADSRVLVSETRKQWARDKLGVSQQPKIEDLMLLVEKRPAPVEVRVSPALSEVLCCTFVSPCDRPATILIDKLGFPYLSSITWQSGLFHKKRGGLWLDWNYGARPDCEKKCKDEADHVPCNDLFPTFKPTSTPVTLSPRLGVPKINHLNVTALSAATCFTLMAQGRLGGVATSKQISDVLKEACTLFKASRKDTTDDDCRTRGYTNPSLHYGKSPTKCGLTTSPLVRHDCILVNRTVKSKVRGDKKLRYVVVLLTVDAVDASGKPLKGKRAECFFRNGFLIDVDNLIQVRNP
jgi:hypothetical protein